jgi:lysophospholipase L1-like esterase
MVRVPVRAALVLLAALLLGSPGAEAARPPLAAVPIARLYLHWWKARHEEKLAEVRHGRFDLVLLGDSITQQYERPEYRPVWQRFYGRWHTLNLGFIGDATSHLLWRIEHGEIDGIAPKAAVILIGANNLGRLHWPAADDVRGIEAVVAATHRRLPRTKLLLLGVLPSDRGAWVLHTTAEINAALAAEYGRGAVSYVTFRDLSGLFLRGGAVDRALFRDPSQTPPEPALHPSPEGMARLDAAIAPILEGWLGAR